jgi:allantoate deiminase
VHEEIELSATTARVGIQASAAGEAAARVMRRCSVLAQITERSGEILRTFLSPAMDDVHRTMRPWMEAAGMAVAVDQAGNLRGIYPANVSEQTPRLLIGSHLDTVPNAGPYDGVLGVLMGLALVEALAAIKLAFAIEVIGFSDEEGTRFGVPFLGSRASVGELHDSLLASRDKDGVTMGEALRKFAALRTDAVDPKLSPRSEAYLEFHIEQGPVLETKNLSLGIVEGLAGQSRSRVIFRGRAGHAGTTPMKLRHDALAAAAEWMTRVEMIANGIENAVATVGQIGAEPGAVNVIPGLVRCSLDVRHSQDGIRDQVIRASFEEAHAIGLRRGVAATGEQYSVQPAVRLDPTMVALAERACMQAGYETMRMTSGAGHDAMVIAGHLPSAMIFLRNPGGISHHPDESVAEQDVAAALHAGLLLFDEFAVWLKEKERAQSA